MIFPNHSSFYDWFRISCPPEESTALYGQVSKQMNNPGFLLLSFHWQIETSYTPVYANQHSTLHIRTVTPL